jgi:hypothetical protein
MSVLFSVFGQDFFYDLAIHSVAIGFIGITIALYLPLMIPTILSSLIECKHDFTIFDIA